MQMKKKGGQKGGSVGNVSHKGMYRHSISKGPSMIGKGGGNTNVRSKKLKKVKA